MGSLMWGSLPRAPSRLPLADPSAAGAGAGGSLRPVASPRAGLGHPRRVPEAGPAVAALRQTRGSLWVTAVRGCY